MSLESLSIVGRVVQDGIVAKPSVRDLKRIYQSVSPEETKLELKTFDEKCNERYPSIQKLWERH